MHAGMKKAMVYEEGASERDRQEISRVRFLPLAQSFRLSLICRQRRSKVHWTAAVVLCIPPVFLSSSFYILSSSLGALHVSRYTYRDTNPCVCVCLGR